MPISQLMHDFLNQNLIFGIKFLIGPNQVCPKDYDEGMPTYV